jgi:hypothetical protein
VNLLHRQVVRAKAEGLFFQVSRRRPPRVSPGANWTSASVLNVRLGIHPEPVQDHPRGSKVFSQRSAVQGSRGAHQLRTPSVLQSRGDGPVCPRRGVLPPYSYRIHARSGVHPIFFMGVGVLPEEPKSMEEVLRLGARVKDEGQGQGSRHAVPAGCPSQERVHVERTTRDCHGRPSGGWPERANRVGEGGLSVPYRKMPRNKRLLMKA